MSDAAEQMAKKRLRKLLIAGAGFALLAMYMSSVVPSIVDPHGSEADPTVIR